MANIHNIIEKIEKEMLLRTEIEFDIMEIVNKLITIPNFEYLTYFTYLGEIGSYFLSTNAFNNKEEYLKILKERLKYPIINFNHFGVYINDYIGGNVIFSLDLGIDLETQVNNAYVKINKEIDEHNAYNSKNNLKFI